MNGPAEYGATSNRRGEALDANAVDSRFETAGFSVNLPKGGGAIRGIDEKIDVDPFRGAARLSIPLPIHAARGGVAPELKLEYGGGAGNGPFGAGWSVAPPCVFRRTDKGIPRYDDEDESDALVAPGADEVV